MSDDMDKNDYAKHLVKHGLSDARMEKTLIASITKPDVNTMMMNNDPDALTKKSPIPPLSPRKKSRLFCLNL